mgnify:CR=1 FL=1|jgi:ATP-binding cassette subfamily C protein LapB
MTVYFASSVVNLLALALPLTVLQIYDRVLPNAAFDTLAVLIAALVGVVAIDAVLKYFRASVVNWSAASFTHKLTTKALATMLTTRPSQYSRTTASEHLERLNAISGLGGHLGGQSRIVAVDILFIPIFAGVIVMVGGAIFFVVLSLFAFFGYLALRRTRALNDTIAERETHESRKHDFVIEVLRAMQTVKASAMEPLIMRRFERLQSAASMITKRTINLTGTAQTYSAMYASLSVIAIVGIGAILVLNGRLTLGALACCMLLSSQLLQPLMRSLASWNEIQLAKHRRERISTIFSDSKEEAPAQVHYQRKVNPKKITLKNVTVQYGDAPPIFSGVYLEIPAGALVAIKGADGSGRSSLLRLLMDDTPVTQGEVLIGNDNNLSNARGSVRYVGQTPTLFRGTILDNLTLFGELPAKTALMASRIVGLNDEIVRMPQGYDTMLKSAAGRDIPAPTAQRLCIARAIAMRPSVLILDEANTLLDFAGEQRFIEALERLRGKITIIVATHRPSLIRMADQAYEVAGGGVKPLDRHTPDEKAAAS